MLVKISLLSIVNLFAIENLKVTSKKSIVKLPDYNLTDLHSTEFEEIIQSLLKRIIGSDTITFGAGKDGGREATFSGQAPYPNLIERWKGEWIFQAKFHDINRIGHDKAREKIIEDLKEELNKITSKYQCENYILATNVILTPVSKSGTIDKINKEIIPLYKDKIKNIRVWGYDDICKFIDNYEDIRHAYSHLLTSGDLIAVLIEKMNILEEIQEKLNLSALKFSEKEIREYFDNILDFKYEGFYDIKTSNIKLRDHYINQNALLLPFNKTWLTPDKDLNQVAKFQDPLKLVNDLLKAQSLILIGSHFGIGKSTLAKMIAIIGIIELLQNNEQTNHVKYFPIYVNLRFGLFTDYKQFSLQNFLNRLNIKNRDKIFPLLILDGLDEYKEDNKLSEKIDELRNSYSDLKIIITTRIQENILEKHNLHFGNYVRLLPFSPLQFDIFCEKFQIIYDNKRMTFDKAKELNFPLEILSIPLFLLILSAVKDKLTLIKSTWNSEMIKAWILLQLFHNIIQGKYRNSKDSYNNLHKFRDEKKNYRLIAALNQVFVPFTIEKFKQYQTNLIRGSKIQVNDLSLTLVNRTHHGEIIYFLHSSFEDYLLAEYYLEAIIEKKFYKLYTITPRPETINFLSGLVELLRETKKNPELKDNIITDPFSFVNSITDEFSLNKFSYYNNLDDIVATVEEITLEYLKEPNSIGWMKITDDTKPYYDENDWVHTSLIDFQVKNLLIHKWIVLFVNRKLNPNKKLKDKKVNKNISMMIKTFSNVTSYYLKFLPNVDLSGFDLSGARLRDANLEFADFIDTKLENSDLCSAKLNNANLTKANLSYTDISFAKGNYAIFDNANLTGAIIISSDFSCCKFNHAIMYSSNLYNTKFENSHFTDIDIYERRGLRLETNVATFDFTTNKFPLLFCEKTNFKNAVFSNVKIIQYLKKQGGLNLPDSSTNS